MSQPDGSVLRKEAVVRGVNAGNLPAGLSVSIMLYRDLFHAVLVFEHRIL